MTAGRPRHGGGDAARVAVASAVLLFAEVAIIRWTTSELPALLFFRNLVLVASFLGGGLGIAAGPRRPRLRLLGPPLLLVVAGLVPWLGENFRALGPMRFGDWSEHRWSLGAASTLLESARFLAFFVVLFVVVLVLFVGLGAAIGRALARLPPLPGYACNLLGSLAGVLGFAALGLAQAPPPVWWLVLALPAAWVLLDGWRGRLLAAAAVAGAAFAASALSSPATWSLYSRIQVDRVVLEGESQPTVHVATNRSYSMRALDLDQPAAWGPVRLRARRHYDLPYRLVKPQSVLVLGAGTGNDVAAALRAGAAEIDAVEIDRAILDKGRELHPERPYDSPRVRPIVDDGRAFLTGTERRYDLIVLGLVDSKSLFASSPDVRLDNFVYTLESVREMRRHLTPGGILTVSFAVPLEQLWVALKLDRLIEQAFESPPLLFTPLYDSSFTFVAGPGLDARALRAAAEDPALVEIAGNRAALAAEALKVYDEPRIPTDDWPHLYMRQAGLSTGQLLLFLPLILVSLGAVRALQPLSGRIDLHFALLGAAFLLVETKGISDLGLVFGGPGGR